MNVSVVKSKCTEGKVTIPVPIRCFLAALFQFVKKATLCPARTIGPSVARMTGTRDELSGKDRCVEMSLKPSGGLLVQRYTGRDRDVS